MAKIGEGDPRWIVSQRDDGKNVNAWHWEEKDLSKSCHDQLREAVKDKVVHNADGVTLKLNELSEIDGDVTVAQRKGKIMCYFEIKCTAKWSGAVRQGEEDKTVEGKLVVPEVDHDSFREDFAINVSTMDRNDASAKAEGIMQKEGRKVLRTIIREQFEEVFKQYNVGSKAGGPNTAASAGKATITASSTTMPKPAAAPTSSTASAPSSETPAKSDAPTSFSWTIDWGVPADELFATLTDERRASGYTRCTAKIEPRPAGTFDFLGGAITGYYGEVVPGKKLTMQWRLSSWAAGHHSSVVIELNKEEAGVTRMSFAQAGIPVGEVDRVKQGWTMNFFEPIKMMMGYSLTWVNQ